MKRNRGIALAAVGAVAALVLAACGGSSGGNNNNNNNNNSNAAFNAGTTGVVNASNAKGGTLSFDNSSAVESTDPGNIYYAYEWNFVQLYSTPLMTYKACPGNCGLQLAPALATSPGIVSDNGLTWTYHIKPNVKFEDGTTITSQDVKYAVERTFDRGKFPLGPAYFTFLLAPQKPAYPGPYTDRSKNLMGLNAVTTPDATTIVFHLAKPFADFNYVVAIPQTAPVPPNKDTGANYQLHPVSSGPYMFQSYQINKQLTLVPNPHWDPATNPQVKQLPSKITMTMNVNANDIDNRLMAGDLSVDAAGTGVQAAARAKILSTPSLKAQADNPLIPRLWFAAISTQVPPLTNVHCRMAVEYAASKVDYQTAYGGPVAGGAIASTASPPVLIGHKNFDLYEATTKPNGDLTKAKQELAACGQPNGFTTAISYRSDRPKEVSAAQALQASLARVGIKTSLHGYPTATYTANFAGVPKYAHAHDLGIIVYGWAPDWPDGFGQFYYIVDGAAISPAGNTNLAELNDPVVNNLLTKFGNTTDDAARNALTSQIDMQVMKDAAILPGVYAKNLLYRPPNMTNVFVQQAYGMYDYATLGVKG
jgi:peptide/nickel transport system substrate-binding protein